MGLDKIVFISVTEKKKLAEVTVQFVKALTQYKNDCYEIRKLN